MSILSNYQDFKAHQPEYKDWKEQRDLNLQKKLEYIKNNKTQIPNYEEDIKRAKIILNAVNVMDEYSQTKAEDMEQITQTISAPIAQFLTYVSIGLGALVAFVNKNSRNALKDILNEGNFKNIKSLFPAAFVAGGALLTSITTLSTWGCSQQLKASRMGRTEAMMSTLSSVNQFAVLDDTQEKEQEKIANTITVDKKEAKSALNANKGLGIIDSIKTIFKPDENIVKQQKEFNQKIQKEIENVDNLKLNENDVLQAKRDQDLIQNIVEKVDIASQDYAENTELTTNVLTGLISASGIVAFAAIEKLLSKIKPVSKYSKYIAAIVSGGYFIGSVALTTKLQKQASRVGRFKAKNELLENPEQLVYVDPEKYKNMEVKPQEKKKIGYIQQVINLFKDNKKYNEYVKNNNIREVQLRKAKDKINLSDEQIKRANQLKNNVFKMFNKLDEKSQAYSESTEAIGEVVSTSVGLVGSILSSLLILKKTSNMASGFKALDIAKSILPFLPVVGLEIFVTKEQKAASRVADMLAINELNDYRHFASNNPNSISKNESEKAKQKINSDVQMSPILEQMLNKKEDKKAT